MLSEAEINQIKEALRPMIVEEFSFRINEAIKDQIVQEVIEGLDRIAEKLDRSFAKFSEKITGEITSEIAVGWKQTNDLLGNIHGRQEKLIEGQDKLIAGQDRLLEGQDKLLEGQDRIIDSINTLSTNVVGSVDQLSTKVDTLSTKMDTFSTRIVNSIDTLSKVCLLYTSPSPRDATLSRMPSSA